MKKKITIMRWGVHAKPENAAPHQNIHSYEEKELATTELFNLVASGYSYRCANYAEGAESMGKSFVKECGMIALDFDKSPHTPEEICEYAASIGFPANMFYYTFSQGKKEGNNFRVLWVLEEFITPKEYEGLYSLLLGETFAKFNPDKATKDASRLWYGGKGGELLREEFVSLKTLGWLEVVAGLAEGKRHRNMKTQKKGLAAEYYKEDFQSSNPSTYNISISTGISEPKNEAVITENWKEILAPRCPLFEKLLNGEKLNHNERVTLVTNLKELRYAAHDKSLLQEVAELFNWEQYGKFSPQELKRFWLDKNLEAYPIIFSSDDDAITVAEFFNNPEGENIHVDKSSYSTIEELDVFMAKNLPAFLSSSSTSYFVSQTASGKTEHIINWLINAKKWGKKIVLAFPRYNLMEEFAARVYLADTNKQVNLIVSPQAQYTEADKRRMAMGAKPLTGDSDRKEFITKLMDDGHMGVFLCTHALVSHFGRELGDVVDVIIIDENPELEFIKWNTITIPQLRTLHSVLPARYKETLENGIEKLEGMDEGELLNFNEFHTVANYLASDDAIMESYLNKNSHGNHPANFLAIGEAVKIFKTLEGLELHFQTSLFYGAAPVKILTATPLTQLVKHLCPHIEITTAPKAKNAGIIKQFLGVTGSKGMNNKNIPKLINFVKQRIAIEEEEISEYVVITFKNAAQQFRKAGFMVVEVDGKDIHFANNSGLDCLKGKKVIVAGKYDYPDAFYHSLCRAIGGDIEMMHRQNRRHIIHNIPRKLYLIEGDEMQQTQLELIAFYTEQTLGRARALREETAKVMLFNNIPAADVDVYNVQKKGGK